MIWYNSEINQPPKDRLILVTSGIAWRREDEEVPPYLVRGKVAREGYIRHNRREIGGCHLVYWWPIEKNDPYDKDLYPGYWHLFGGGYGPRDFKYWTEYENPISQSLEGSIHSTTVMDVMDLPIYVPSQEELENRKLQKMLGL